MASRPSTLEAPAAPFLLTLNELTEAAAGIIEQHIPEARGACLGSSAILARALIHAGVPAGLIHAVHGTMRGEAHWWLELDGYRADPQKFLS